MPSKPQSFRPSHLGTMQQAKRQYEIDRGSARERGYNTRWDANSLRYRREHALCLGCEAVGRFTVTEVVDHIIPHKGDNVLMWDESNWQPSCGPHHDVVKQRIERRYAQG